MPRFGRLIPDMDGDYTEHQRMMLERSEELALLTICRVEPGCACYSCEDGRPEDCLAFQPEL
jgi:hypothetical protein